MLTLQGPPAVKKGKLNRRIKIDRMGPPVDDGYTTEPGGWTELCQAWAAVYYGSGSEQRQAAQESASQAASFEVQSNPKTRAVSVTDRIIFDGGEWDITANIEIDRGAGRRITAVRKAA